MARKTGDTCTGMVSLIARGLWTAPALVEIVGRNEECFRAVVGHLEEREVHLFEEEVSRPHPRFGPPSS
jgi:hypothetical protein